MFKKLKMAEALLQSGRNYERGAGDFKHSFVSASRIGQGIVCSLAGEETCHALTRCSGPQDRIWSRNEIASSGTERLMSVWVYGQ